MTASSAALVAFHRASGPFAASASAGRPPSCFSFDEGPRAIPFAARGAELEAWASTLDGREQALDARTLSWLLSSSLGASDEKIGADGSRYSVWCNPTSGNLHTIECDVILTDQQRAGVLHYDSVRHGLVELAPGIDSVGDADAALVALSIVYGRQLAKYGDRGLRYAWIDLGHAIGAVEVAAESLGWSVESVESDSVTRALEWDVDGDPFGRRRGALLRVGPSDRPCASEWRLAHALRRPRETAMQIAEGEAGAWLTPSDGLEARTLALPRRGGFGPRGALLQRRRRSAHSFVPGGPVARPAFEAVLAPLASMRFVEAIVLVHRVEGVPPGAYRCQPDGGDRALLEPLVAGDLSELGVGLHAYQVAAHEHAFSITFALSERTVESGIAVYRRAHVEAGCLGQRLYLAAQSASLPATGIGALLDEEFSGTPALSHLLPIYSFACGSFS